jgi:hypothetical protein
MAAITVPAMQTGEIQIDIENNQKVTSPNDKTLSEAKHIEQVVSDNSNINYDQVDEEPELHARTYLALVAMFLLNMVQVIALSGPPAVVCDY